MRGALTLIELIFSMVIIATAFTVFPKVLQISAKSAKTTLKEEALYNAVALAGLIKNLPWDEKNTLLDDILIARGGHVEYNCSKRWGGYYRKGGFVGSRNCMHQEEASVIGDDGDTVPDDIDDFAGKSIRAASAKREYLLDVNVSYVEDIEPGDTGQFSLAPGSLTNTKYISIIVKPQKKSADLSSAFGKIDYHAHNIGQISVNKLAWEQ